MLAVHQLFPRTDKSRSALDSEDLTITALFTDGLDYCSSATVGFYSEMGASIIHEFVYHRPSELQTMHAVLTMREYCTLTVRAFTVIDIRAQCLNLGNYSTYSSEGEYL